MSESYKSVQEVTEYLGIKPDTQYKWLPQKYKNIPAQKIGLLLNFKSVKLING